MNTPTLTPPWLQSLRNLHNSAKQAEVADPDVQSDTQSNSAPIASQAPVTPVFPEPPIADPVPLPPTLAPPFPTPALHPAEHGIALPHTREGVMQPQPQISPLIPTPSSVPRQPAPESASQINVVNRLQGTFGAYTAPPSIYSEGLGESVTTVAQGFVQQVVAGLDENPLFDGAIGGFLGDGAGEALQQDAEDRMGFGTELGSFTLHNVQVDDEGHIHADIHPVTESGNEFGQKTIGGGVVLNFTAPPLAIAMEAELSQPKSVPQLWEQKNFAPDEVIEGLEDFVPKTTIPGVLQREEMDEKLTSAEHHAFDMCVKQLLITDPVRAGIVAKLVGFNSPHVGLIRTPFLAEQHIQICDKFALEYGGVDNPGRVHGKSLKQIEKQIQINLKRQAKEAKLKMELAAQEQWKQAVETRRKLLLKQDEIVRRAHLQYTQIRNADPMSFLENDDAN